MEFANHTTPRRVLLPCVYVMLFYPFSFVATNNLSFSYLYYLVLKFVKLSFVE